MANGNDDPRIYQALALPEQALENGGLEILRAGIVKDELYVSALPAFKAPAQWGEVLADIARRLGAIYAAQDTGLSKKDVTVQIAEAFAADMGARPVKAAAASRAPPKRPPKKPLRNPPARSADAMPINILMPALSPTMEKGNLAKWLKKEGDKVKSGDVIAEIETDKATMEVEAVDEGTIAKIVVPEGTADVPVNQVIAVLAGEGEDVKAAAAGAGKGAPAPAPKPQVRPSAPTRRRRPKAPTPAQSLRPAAAPSTTAPAPGPGVAQRNAAGFAPFASPLARRLAKEAGIDLSRIQGSGPHGRVIARDVEGAKSGKGMKPAGAPAAAPSGAPSIAPSMSDAQVRALFEEGSYEVVPHDGMRRTIAQRLTQSTQTIPHFYLTIDCNIGKLDGRARGDQRGGAQGQGRQAGLQAFGQRLRAQGAGARVATHPRRQRELDRRRHAQAQAFRHRRRRGAARVA